MEDAVKILKKKLTHDIVTVLIAGVLNFLMMVLPFIVAFDEKGPLIDICFTLAGMSALLFSSALPLIRLRKMPNALGLESESELEDYIDNCECLNWDFFRFVERNNDYCRGNKACLSDRYLIDFHSCIVIPLSDITSLKPDKTLVPARIDKTIVNSRKRYACLTYYAIIVRATKMRKCRIYFKYEEDRDLTIKRLSTYSDFAQGQEYID